MEIRKRILERRFPAVFNKEVVGLEGAESGRGQRTALKVEKTFSFVLKERIAFVRFYHRVDAFLVREFLRKDDLILATAVVKVEFARCSRTISPVEHLVALVFV